MTTRTSDSQPLETDNHKRDVIIIGGGVIGAATAYFLAKQGAQVTVIERGKFGKACSHGNCGYISPSHILPLCQPGAIGSTFKTLFKRNSPFKIKPRFDADLISWLWKFARNCNKKHMLAAGHARQHLLNSSRALYAELIESGELTDCEWQTKGLMFVFNSQSHFEHHAHVVELLREEYNVQAVPYAGAELIKLEPALKPGPAGGWLYPDDAHVRPDKVMSAWQNRLHQLGVVIREEREFLGFDVSNKRVHSINTSAGKMETDQVVIATGAWTPLLKQHLKLSVPIQPGKGYSITMNRPGICPEYPMLFEEHRVGITPMQTGYRIGSTMEFAGYDTSMNPARIKLLTDGAKYYLHEPMSEPILETWYGWRPMSCDGVPMIGLVPAYSNVWMAAGHSMLGLSMATGTGKLLSEMICGNKTHLDPEPYRLNRF